MKTRKTIRTNKIPILYKNLPFSGTQYNFLVLKTTFLVLKYFFGIQNTFLAPNTTFWTRKLPFCTKHYFLCSKMYPKATFLHSKTAFHSKLLLCLKLLFALKNYFLNSKSTFALKTTYCVQKPLSFFAPNPHFMNLHAKRYNRTKEFSKINNSSDFWALMSPPLNLNIAEFWPITILTHISKLSSKRVLFSKFEQF